MGVWEVEENDGIVVAAHNNPPMNYFVGASATGLAEMLPRWREDDVRVVIITGAIPGKYITHYSVEELVELAEDREKLTRASNELISGWHQLLQSLAYLDKPIIAAMTGDTGGGGLELSLNCDIRIMERGDYLLGFPEASLGILTGTGSQLLERAIGRSRALDFLLRSRYVTPRARSSWGSSTSSPTTPKHGRWRWPNASAATPPSPSPPPSARSSAAPICRCRRASKSRPRSG